MSTHFDPRLADPYELQSTLGYSITRWEPGLAVVEMPLTSLHMNRHRTPHGGVLSTLLDTACSFCGTCQGEGRPSLRAMTLSLNVNFLSQPRGNRLIATGRKTGGGRRNFFSHGDLKDETGQLIATATATMRYRAGEN